MVEKELAQLTRLAFWDIQRVVWCCQYLCISSEIFVAAQHKYSHAYFWLEPEPDDDEIEIALPCKGVVGCAACFDFNAAINMSKLTF